MLGVWNKNPIGQEGRVLIGTTNVVGFLDRRNGCCNSLALEQAFLTEEIMQIQRLPYLTINCEDKLVWIVAKDGKFTVKSCYDLITEGSREHEALWGLLWKFNLHERIKSFYGDWPPMYYL